VKNNRKSNGTSHANGHVNGQGNRQALPVVIAGAGPVGCALALYLAQQDIPVIILEAGKDLPEDLRASTFHPPN